jgi:hypothetical protein
MDHASSDLTGSETSSQELAQLRMEFPGFIIWLEHTPRGEQYVARRTRADLHPHTVVTRDPGDLRGQLAQSSAAGNGRAT